MVALSLKICVRQCNVVKTMQFEPSTPVYDACRIIRERVPEAQTGQGEHCVCLGEFMEGRGSVGVAGVAVPVSWWFGTEMV